MRDLGLMGESIFSLWCADAGLIPNGSQIDKTGWDFFVEFPFNSGFSPREIHKSPFECKVQVKATDKNDRKLPITLSNLRRLITAQMPAFFVFIEFDGKDTAQKAFVVHVDNDLISKVLKKLHKIEQSPEENNFNKRKMTIYYDESNVLDQPNGNCLKKCLLTHMGNNISKYIENKKSHLESTGYENGFAQITFTTVGEDNLKSLIDVSLGLEKEVEVSKIKGVDTRFGILSDNPLLSSDACKLAMPNLAPTAKGKIRFKEDRFSSGLVFECKFYNSPFNIMVPNELIKFRVEGDFFDLKFSPYTGEASYSFSFGEGVRLEVNKFRDAVRLLNILFASGKKIIAELIVDGFPKFEFSVGCNVHEFEFSRELKALDSAVKVISSFEYTDFVDISFEEISRYGSKICQMEEVLFSSSKLFRVEFGVDGEGYDPSKDTACLFLVSTPIGSHIFGVIAVLTGGVEQIENGRFRLLTKDIAIERRIVSERDEAIPNEYLVSVIDDIEKRYDENYSVVTIFEKNPKKM